MFELDVNLPERLRPLAWLIGRWEGAGVLGYPTIESMHYGQEIRCWHDGRAFLQWEARAWILDSENGERVRPASIETGFWRPGEDGREVVEQRSQARQLRALIEALPDEQRAVLLMVTVDGLSYKDTAQALGVPVGTVMSRLSRARLRLADGLGEER